ncbi:hypothetical protein JNM87_03220 [Candidatus Saccharibacteria bacterium]|nr:hypothetical protein [Candidatus Saccharibacteria bacterium]
MKAILVYGDSNTWGQTKWPFLGEPRLAYEDRWTSKVQQRFAANAQLIVEGLPGRTAGDVQVGNNQYRNGKIHFKSIFKSHEPIDFVIIALGTNDIQIGYRRTASDITTDILWYEKSIQQWHLGDYPTPHVLYIIPPALKVSAEDSYFGGRDIVREQLASSLKSQPGLKTILPGSIDLSEDGVHFSPKGHSQMARAVSKKLEEIGL